MATIEKIIQVVIPALSQSRQAQMGCHFLYHHREVLGEPRLDTVYAARGRTIHKAIQDYIKHLCETEQPSDYGYLEKLAGQHGEDVAEVLEAFKENYTFDPAKVLKWEWHIQLDENFVSLDSKLAAGPACYEGTLDLVLVEDGDKLSCVIDDWKSHFSIFPADTFQSRLYPLLLFCENPGLKRVVFRLQFVRYGAVRQVEFTRDDVPKLMKEAKAERERQLAYHAGKEEPKATPGSHCSYCPFLANGCPMDAVNPRATMTAEQRVGYALYLNQAKRENDAILKEACTERGPIRHQDENGQSYVASFAPSESKTYPLGKTVTVLENQHINPYNTDLKVGSTELKRLAKKTPGLLDALDKVATSKIGTRFSVKKEKEEGDQEDS